MIVYSSTKKGFLSDVMTGYVDQKILTSFVRELGHSTGKSEMRSWKNSMPYMSTVINHPDIPDDVGVSIEYKIPQTSKRIDFIITGLNQDKKNTAVLIELKQWESAKMTELDGVVKTFVGGCEREVSHPSYQVWSYAMLLEDYNSNVQDEGVSMVPCAYLHNYETDNVIKNDFYKEYTEKAPVFIRSEALDLQNFIRKFVKYGDNKDLMYLIENGKIRPSKALADSLASMLNGNQEFILLDDQKIVFEKALKLAKESSIENKNVLIVEGGPGTGKSVVAINLLAELTNLGNVTQYVTKNSAPREVYQVKLSGKFTKTRISNLFSSSGSFYNVEPNTFDSLIIDEAHRLNKKSGLFNNLGINQIKELIEAAKFSIFFIDEDQRVTLKDIGRKATIEKWAKIIGANVHYMALASQFRCNGSDGYLAWLDDVLQIRETANEDLEDIDFDFRVMDTPFQLHQKIMEKNRLNNKARVVAGYCWKWISKKNPESKDIVINDYMVKWNLNSHGQAWIIHPESVTEVGCIHTCQGLELDYVGVIIGEDLVVRNGVIITDPNKRASTDQSLKGLKAMLQKDPEKAKTTADAIIKNTYRTLMTRGMKGCYIYSVDPETQKYFRNKLVSNAHKDTYANIPEGLSLNLEKVNE